MPSDFKKPRRIKDPKLFKRLHEAGVQCCLCARKAELHHVLQRGSPYHGDDVEGNLIGLCALHHTLYHSSDLDTRNDIGSWIIDERPDVIAYVHRKLGPVAGADWLRRKLLIP